MRVVLERARADGARGIAEKTSFEHALTAQFYPTTAQQDASRSRRSRRTRRSRCGNDPHSQHSRSRAETTRARRARLSRPVAVSETCACEGGGERRPCAGARTCAAPTSRALTDPHVSESFPIAGGGRGGRAHPAVAVADAAEAAAEAAAAVAEAVAEAVAAEADEGWHKVVVEKHRHEASSSPAARRRPRHQEHGRRRERLRREAHQRRRACPPGPRFSPPLFHAPAIFLPLPTWKNRFCLAVAPRAARNLLLHPDSLLIADR